MKIRMSQLRKIIKEELEELEELSQDAAVPGRWFPYDGDPVDPDEIKLMGTGGLGRKTRRNRRKSS